MTAFDRTVEGMDVFPQTDTRVVHVNQKDRRPGRETTDGLISGHDNTEACAVGAAEETLLAVTGPAAVHLEGFG